MDVIANYEMLEACVLSGQMSEADLQAEFTVEPGFRLWFEARAKARQGETSTASLLAKVDDLEKSVAWFRHLCDLRGDLLKVRAEELRKRNAEYDMVVRRCAEQAKAYAALLLQLRDMNAEPEPEPNPIFAALAIHQSQGVR